MRLDLNPKKAMGLGEKLMGLSKEILGTVWGSERLQKAGESQQVRGSESLKALRAEAVSEAKDVKATALGKAQLAAQQDKEEAAAEA